MNTTIYCTEDDVVEGLTKTIAQLQLHELSGSMGTAVLAKAIYASSPTGRVSTHDLVNALVPD